MIMGMTISLAGNARINARSITPSSPNSLANGSRDEEKSERRVFSPTLILARHHIITPAGMADITALPRTKAVLSTTDRTIIFPTSGERYGGSSRVNDEGRPFKRVDDSNLDTRRVIMMLKMIISVSNKDETKEEAIPEKLPTKNTVIRAIRSGNLPLQGTRLFVSIAIMRSR